MSDADPSKKLPATITHTANDSVSRYLFNALDIRGQVVRLGANWQNLLLGREYPEPIITMLGELVAVGVLLGAGLKHPGRVTLQIQGDGPVDLAVADCTHDLKIRAMVRTGERLKGKLAKLVEAKHRATLPPAMRHERFLESADAAPPERLTFTELVGSGKLAISVENQLTGQIYQSFVPLDGLTVAECFENYFDQSEQVPTHLWLAADESAVGAMLLQKLPGADKKDADGWARVDQLASTVAHAELTGLPAEQLLHRLFNEEDVTLQPPRLVQNGCVRDASKVEAMLRSLGRKELEDAIREQGEVVVRDDMCNFEYRYDADAIRKLFDDDEPQPPTVH
jgi:molecular chaperone Hsp33